MCAGVHKGGTTWLYQQLDSHPDFWMPPFKEMHYFDQLSKVDRSSSPRCRDERDLRFHENMKSLSAKSSVDFDHYARLFESKGALLSGDISPNYSTLPGKLIRRIAGYFPNLKVLFMVRDPVERLWSHLSMEVHYRQIESFDATDIEEVNRKLLRRGMLVRSYPSAAVARWRRYVHPDRFRVYSLMICKEIPPSCDGRSLVSWKLIRRSRLTNCRPVTIVGREWKSYPLQRKCGHIWVSSSRKS